MKTPEPAGHGWRHRTHEVIFESDTAAGKWFDLFLIALIMASTAVVMLESVAPIRQRHGALLRTSEWVFTALFSGVRL